MPDTTSPQLATIVSTHRRFGRPTMHVVEMRLSGERQLIRLSKELQPAPRRRRGVSARGHVFFSVSCDLSVCAQHAQKERFVSTLRDNVLTTLTVCALDEYRALELS